MLFCPYCHLILIITSENSKSMFSCPVCTFVQPIESKIIKSHVLTKRKVDEVFTTDSDTPMTKINCEKCLNDTAYYIQMQTRSADEPATIFYKCTNTKCNNTWKEN